MSLLKSSFSRLAVVVAVIALSASAPPADVPAVTAPFGPTAVATVAPQGDPYCHDCIGPCAYQMGGSCSPGAAGRIGYTECSTEHGVLEPLPGVTLSWCSCNRSAGVICEAQEALGPEERDAVEQEAITVVAAGEMLPANGFFYVASSLCQAVVRWKCDGDVAGRLGVSYSNIGNTHILLP